MFNRPFANILNVTPSSALRTPKPALSEDTLKLFFMGNSHRVLGETPTNHASSRSHAVFTLAISSEREEEINGDGETDGSDDGNTRTIVSRADLSLVDLAGYERMYKNDQDG